MHANIAHHTISSGARRAVRFWYGCQDAADFDRRHEPGEEEAFDLGLLTPRQGGYAVTARASDLGIVEGLPEVDEVDVDLDETALTPPTPRPSFVPCREAPEKRIYDLATLRTRYCEASTIKVLRQAKAEGFQLCTEGPARMDVGAGEALIHASEFGEDKVYAVRPATVLDRLPHDLPDCLRGRYAVLTAFAAEDAVRDFLAQDVADTDGLSDEAVSRASDAGFDPDTDGDDVACDATTFYTHAYMASVTALMMYAKKEQA